MGSSTAVFGIYMNRAQVDEAVDTLRMDGFRTAGISVLLPDQPCATDFGHETTNADDSGALGLLAGIGALAIPGFGLFIAAGPIIGSLAGADGAGGGVAGALVGLGVPEYKAKRYEGRMKSGGILLSVHCDNAECTDRAKRILDTTGAHDVASTAGTEYAASGGSMRSQVFL
jgi:hypothetical protein